MTEIGIDWRYHGYLLFWCLSELYVAARARMKMIVSYHILYNILCDIDGCG